MKIDKEQTRAKLLAQWVELNEHNFDQKIDLTTWNLGTAEAIRDLIDKAIHKAATEALQIAVEQEPASIDIDIVDDLVTFTVTLPLGVDQYCGPAWTVTLRDAIAYIPEAYGTTNEAGEISINDPDDRAFAEKVRDQLRLFADQLDQCLAVPTRNKGNDDEHDTEA